MNVPTAAAKQVATNTADTIGSLPTANFAAASPIAFC